MPALTGTHRAACVAGNEHKLSYVDLQEKYSHVAPDTLPRLLQHALTAQRLRASLNIEGDRSLLVAGAVNKLVVMHHVCMQGTQSGVQAGHL